jgi:competence protein ComEC
MKRPLPLILFAYIAGIIGGSYFRLPSSWALAGIMGAGMGLVICMAGGKRKGGLVFSPILFIFFGFLFIGRILQPDFPPNHLIHYAGDPKFNIEGLLYRAPEPLEDKVRVFVRAEKIHGEGGPWPVTGNLLLTVKDKQGDLRYGDRVRFISRIYVPRPATNPGAFDYRRFLALRGIWVTAYANSAAEVVRLEEKKGNPFFQFVERGREKIRKFIDENASPENRGIIKALVLGERGDIPKAVNEKFIITGVNHILSISGLHVALVAAFFFGAIRLFFKMFPSLLLRVNLNKASALVAVVPVIFYLFIAGAGVAAVRSTIMVLSFLLALLLDREKDLYDALFLAAFFILLFNPAALFDISFQLSFLSVAAMLYFIPRFTEYFSFLKTWPYKSWLEEQPPWRRKLMFYLAGTLLTSTAAILGTGPLVGYYFNRVSLVGLFSNLILVPLMGFASTLLSLLSALLVFVSYPLAKFLTGVNGLILDLSLALVDLFSRIPMASRRVVTPTIPELLLIYGMLILAVNLKRWKHSLHGLILLAAVYGGIQAYGYFSIYTSQELKVTFLDVGQGDAAVLQLPHGKVMVIDGGGTPDGNFDPGERIVGPYLWREKRKKIDYMVNSHPHPDHLQGLLFLLDNFEVGNVWNNGDRADESPFVLGLLEKSMGRLQTMGRGGEARKIEGVRVEFLHPPLEKSKGPSFSVNDASLVLRLTYGEVSFLFCGDVEFSGEREILKTGANLQSAVLKVPHHGSKSSSTPDFLEAVRPRYAVFTVRGGARPRLPNPAVLERYKAMGVKVLRSDRDGAVTFITDGKDLKVQTFLKKEPVTDLGVGKGH